MHNGQNRIQIENEIVRLLVLNKLLGSCMLIDSILNIRIAEMRLSLFRAPIHYSIVAAHTLNIHIDPNVNFGRFRLCRSFRCDCGKTTALISLKFIH